MEKLPDEQHEENISPSLPETDEEDQDTVSPDYGDGIPPNLLWLREGENTVVTTIYAYKDPRTSKLRDITYEPSGINRLLKLIEFPIETVWSIPSKQQLDDYRNKAGSYNPQARAVLVNTAKLQDIILRNHLQEMSFSTNGKKSTLPFKKNKQGHLSNESMNTINSLHPSVIEFLYTKFIDDSALSI